MYSFNGRIRYSEVGQDGRLRTDALINYFQDCSTFQSEDLGRGIFWLQERKRCWIINSWQIKVIRLPELGEDVTVWTWPNTLKGVLGTRSYKMTDNEGELLAIATSLWTFFDTENYRPAKIHEEIYSAYELEPEPEIEWQGRKIALPENMTRCEAFPVQLCHIDTNRHVNNGQYVLMALAYLPDNFQLSGMRVEYKKSAVYGDIIYPYVYKKEDSVLVLLADAEGSPYAVTEFKSV